MRMRLAGGTEMGRGQMVGGGSVILICCVLGSLPFESEVLSPLALNLGEFAIVVLQCSR